MDVNINNELYYNKLYISENKGYNKLYLNYILFYTIGGIHMTIKQLQEKLITLETEMQTVSNELVAVINNPKKIKAVKRLSLKLHEVSSQIIETKEQITKLEKEANTESIVDGEYIIEIENNRLATIKKVDGSLVLNYLYSDKLLMNNNVYSAYKRSSGIVNDKDISSLEYHWSAYKGSIAKVSRVEIFKAEEVLCKYVSLFGGKQYIEK